MDLQPLLERRERRVPDWGVHKYKVLIILIVSVIVLTVEIWLSGKPFPVKKALVCYGPLLHMIFIPFLWAINVLLFSKAGVDLPELFGRGTPTDYPTAHAILQRIAWIVALGAINVTIFFGLYSWIEEDKWASLLPVLSYIAGVILLILIFLAKEGDYCYVPFLKYVGEELYQNIVVWSEELPMFRTMFLADILTSTIKVWVDVGSFICQSVCAMMPLASVCGGFYATIGDCIRCLILLFPFLIRVAQCWKLRGERYHFLNVFKYLTAIAAIVLSALKYFFSHDWIFYMWIFFGVVNSVYSIYWDVVEDWNLRNFAVVFNADSPNFWCQLSAYIWAPVSNAFLRCSLLWSYKLLKSEKNRVLIMFMLTALEIFRRFQFTIFRVIALLPQQPSPDNGALLPQQPPPDPQQPPQDPQDPPNEIEVEVV